ncbi:MAG TPA: hypothetical protein VFE30_00555 [Anaeromyxobacteraceae bacterium]|nr:hypothetical protein [Anaeromyxobacteraceae bacterium]
MSPLLERREVRPGTSFWVRAARPAAGERPEGARVPVFSFFEELFRARCPIRRDRQKLPAG